jgi:hypothetical protein
MSSLKLVEDHVAPQTIIDRFARYPLQGMHEFKDVPYMTEKDGNVQCLLCEDYIWFNSFKEHVTSFRHQLRYLQLEQGRKLYLTDERNGRFKVISDTFVDRIQKLSSASAQSHLNDLAFQCIYSPSAIDKDYSKEKGRRWLTLKEQLALYEKEEKEDAEDLVVVKIGKSGKR